MIYRQMQGEEFHRKMATGSIGVRDDEPKSGRVGFADLPEGCISDVIALTSPRDACSLSAVSLGFKSASDSDSVWVRFLPRDIRSVLARASADPSPHQHSLKQLYFSLCNHPVLIDDGKLSFSIDRASGKKCYMISARALSIIWGDSPMYWEWRSVPESRFPEVAVLLDVCWLEIRGRIDVRMLSPSTLYAAFLVFKSNEEFRGFEDQPIEVGVRLFDVEPLGTTRAVYLDSVGTRPVQNQRRRARRFRLFNHHVDADVQEDVPQAQEGDDRYPNERGDRWLEIKLGEFYFDGDSRGELTMSALEVKQLNWKSGLIVEGIGIRPIERN